ncbi:hypothetical protein IIC65_00275 [Candidatus Sumerlaeota bacterium]|nr:hypothetical protein [Candidatus Sumerlaeota bacterium]
MDQPAEPSRAARDRGSIRSVQACRELTPQVMSLATQSTEARMMKSATQYPGSKYWY